MIFQPIQVGAPAVPANNGTVVLMDSTVTFGKMGLPMNGVTRACISFPGLDQASAASGLVGKVSKDKGASWQPYDFSGVLPHTVAADTGATHDSYNVWIGDNQDVQFSFTAGATAPTVWAPVLIWQTGNPQPGF